MGLEISKIVSVKVQIDPKATAFSSILRNPTKRVGKIFQPVKSVFSDKEELF